MTIFFGHLPASAVQPLSADPSVGVRRRQETITLATGSAVHPYRMVPTEWPCAAAGPNVFPFCHRHPCLSFTMLVLGTSQRLGCVARRAPGRLHFLSRSLLDLLILLPLRALRLQPRRSPLHWLLLLLLGSIYFLGRPGRVARHI